MSMRYYVCPECGEIKFRSANLHTRCENDGCLMEPFKNKIDALKYSSKVQNFKPQYVYNGDYEENNDDINVYVKLFKKAAREGYCPSPVTINKLEKAGYEIEQDIHGYALYNPNGRRIY